MRGHSGCRKEMALQDEQRPIEVELKLLFPAEARTLIETHPALTRACIAPPDEQQLVSTYFDTPDHLLAGKGFTLRVRRTQNGRVQTVKAEAGASHSEGDG